MALRALVLGAGGHAASAWEIGLIKGMAEAGIDVRNTDLVVGTSAGARVAVQITSGVPLGDLFERQIDLSRQPPEALPGVDWKQWRAELAHAKEVGGGSEEILRRIGLLALTATSASGSDRQKFIASQLPVQAWPDKKLPYSCCGRRGW
jgi:NTE family protein